MANSALMLGGVSGKIVQVVNYETGASSYSTNTIPWDDTIPQQSEAGIYMTQNFTPTNASNKLRIDVIFQCNVNSSGYVTVALFKDSDADAIAAAVQSLASGAPLNFSFSHYMTAGTTSQIAFKVGAGDSSGGQITMNGKLTSRYLGGVMVSGITITEIAA